MQLARLRVLKLRWQIYDSNFGSDAISPLEGIETNTEH